MKRRFGRPAPSALPERSLPVLSLPAGIPELPPGHYTRAMRKNIRIENPVSGCGFTSKNRAKRFVAQGRAEWVQAGVSIRFVQSDHRHNSAKTSVDATRYW